MPLPNEKINVHGAYTNGYLEIGTQTPKYNENRRLIGKTFNTLYRIRFNRATLTANDQLILGATFSSIKMKISIPYNAEIENYVENKLLIKRGNTLYNIIKTDKYQRQLFLYLATADEKGGKVHSEN